MGWKSIIGCGQTNYDTVQLGFPGTILNTSSYNSSTGAVTLNLTGSSCNYTAGVAITLSGVTGAGSDLGLLNGTFTTVSGSSGNTAVFNIATGKNITSITGGSVVGGGNNNGLAYTQYGPVGGVICTAAWNETVPGVTPAQGILNSHSAHTSSLMTLTMSNIQSLSTTLTHQLQIGGVAGNQVLSITSGTGASAQLTDTTHSDAIPNNVTLALTQGFTQSGVQTGYMVFTGVFWQADQPGGASIPFANAVGNGNQTGGAPSSPGYYSPAAPVVNHNAHVGDAQISAPTAGVWSNHQINIMQTPNGNASNTTQLSACVSAVYQPGSFSATLGNGSLTIAGNAGVGILDDATGTDAVPFGAFINTQIYWNHSFNLYYSALGSTWTSTQQNAAVFSAGQSPQAGIGGAVSVSGIGYAVIRLGAGGFGSQGTEQPCRLPIGGTFSNMNVSVSTATTGTPQPVFFSCPNSNQGNQTGVIPTSPAAVADATHSDAVTAGQYFTTAYTNLTGSFSLAAYAAAFTTGSRINHNSLLLLGVG